MKYLELLEELLSQNEFELLTPENEDPRLVYLMNDAVESFLVFENGTVTGEYDPDYEGELDVTLTDIRKEPVDKNPQNYHLAVKQGSSVVSVFFNRLELQADCYDYGRIAHFWMDGFENLRQIEYRLAILRDKIFYLGEEFANDKEKQLYHLEAFPPLNYTCYPAVPEKYLVTRENAWVPTEEAVSVMKQMCIQTNDRTMNILLSVYGRFPAKFLAGLIAKLLASSRHAALTDRIDDSIEQAASVYPNRIFGGSTEKTYRANLEMAKDRAQKYKKTGGNSYDRIRVLAEEPFTTAMDSIEAHVYIMKIRNGMFKRFIEIEEITDSHPAIP